MKWERIQLSEMAREVVRSNIMVDLKVDEKRANDFIAAGELLLSVDRAGQGLRRCIVSRRQAARLLGVQPPSIAWYVKRGWLKPVRVEGRRSIVGYDVDEIIAYGNRLGSRLRR